MDFVDFACKVNDCMVMIVLFQDRISEIEKHANADVQLDPMLTTPKQEQEVCPPPEPVKLEPSAAIGIIKAESAAISIIKVENTVTFADSDNQQVCPSPDTTDEVVPASPADDIARKKMLQQIESLTRANLKQAKQIRHLQKKTWYQSKRIVKLTATINGLKKQNLGKANPEGSVLDQ